MRHRVAVQHKQRVRRSGRMSLRLGICIRSRGMLCVPLHYLLQLTSRLKKSVLRIKKSNMRSSHLLAVISTLIAFATASPLEVGVNLCTSPESAACKNCKDNYPLCTRDCGYGGSDPKPCLDYCEEKRDTCLKVSVTSTIAVGS